MARMTETRWSPWPAEASARLLQLRDAMVDWPTVAATINAECGTSFSARSCESRYERMTYGHSKDKVATLRGLQWTAERDAKLREIVGAGASASEAAALLSRDFGHLVTRNAVLGRMHRIGLKSTATPPNVDKVKPKPKAPARRQPTGWAARLPHAPPAGTFEPRVTRIPLPFAPVDAVGVTLFDLGPRACRAPLWANDARPTVEAALYCGAPAAPGRCYCAGHAHRFFAVVETPKKRAAA
jgi:GcrA cell cycle regulator